MSEYSEGLRIVTRLGERCTAVPLQVQGSDKTKLKVHGSVKTCLKVNHSYKVGREMHISDTAGAKRQQS